MPIARRDRYEWDCVLSAIEMIRGDQDNDLGLRRINPEVLDAIESKIQSKLEQCPPDGEWKRITVELTESERSIVNRRLAHVTMTYASYQLERLDLLGLYAVDDDFEELRDRILYITTVNPKGRHEELSIWVAHGDVEWLDDWIKGCTTPEGDLR